MHIHCPHCHNPIELVPESPRAEINCPSCGSSFCLDSQSTVVTPEQTKRYGRFSVLELVGQGGFGTVYKARDEELDRTIALKVPRAGSLSGSQELERFLREARSVAQLQHPFIVAVHEVGQVEGVPYLVSDFIHGVSLSDWLSARRPTQRQAAELLASVAEAVQYAHEQGVIHRELKPSNIMLDASQRPFVMDFGLAKRDAGEITMTMAGQVLGTPAYMSPEQARGEAHKVDGRSDVYSLGVILYELLTGELPFRGTKRMLLHQVLHDEPRSPRKLNDTVARDLETICLKAMAKEPSRRYASAGELAEELRRWLRGEPIAARPVGRLERGWRWCRRNPLPASLGGALVAAMLAGTGVSAALAVAALRETERVKAEQQRVLNEQRRAIAVGALEISDPTLPHVRRVGLSPSVREPFRLFQWRVYLPRKGDYRLAVCIAKVFKNALPHDGCLFPYPFKENQRGREVLVSLELVRNQEGDWSICKNAEGDESQAVFKVPPYHAESLARRGYRDHFPLKGGTTYQLLPAESRIKLGQWMASEVGDLATIRSGKAKFGGVAAWLERAEPDGTFSSDKEFP